MPTKKQPANSHETKRNRSRKVGGTCFVIMPFSGWVNGYYEVIYKPAIKAAGLIPRRADDLFRPSSIIHDVWAYTKEATVLLADLTGRNPNVFYELGLAHALGKPVILVSESIEDVPFDLRALRVVDYDKNVPDWGAVLTNKIRTSIKEVLSSPAEAVLPTFLNTSGTSAKPLASGRELELIKLKQELEGLRRQVTTLSTARTWSFGAPGSDRSFEDYFNVGNPPRQLPPGNKIFVSYHHVDSKNLFGSSGNEESGPESDPKPKNND